MGSDAAEEWPEVSLGTETTVDTKLGKSCCLDSPRTGLFNQISDYQDSENTVQEQISLPTEVAPNLVDYNKDASNQSALQKGLCPEPICSISFDNAITTMNQLSDIAAPENEDLDNINSSIDQKVLFVEPKDVSGNTSSMCVPDQVMKDDGSVNVGLYPNGGGEGNMSSSLECPAALSLDSEQGQCNYKNGDSVEKGEIPLPLSLFSTLPSKCGHQDDEGIVDHALEMDSSFLGFVEVKQDISFWSGLTTQVPQLEENACNLLGETPSVASEYAIEGSTSIVYSSSAHLLPADQNIDNCSGLVDSTVQPDSEQRDNDKSEFIPSHACSENIHSLTRKITRRHKSNQISETGKTAKQSKRNCNKKLLSGQNIGISLRFAKRKRSLPSKQVRTSVWGTLGNIMQVFTENASLVKLDNQHIPIKKHCSQRKRRGTQRNKRKSKILDGGSSVASSQQTCSSTSHIRLRVKVGGQRSLEVLLPEGMGSQVSKPSTVSKYENEAESKVSAKFTNSIIHKLGENAHPSSQETCMGEDLGRPAGTCHLDSDQGDKSLESAVTVDFSVGNSLDNIHGVASHTGIAVLDEPVDNQYSYPGTSPDSEVVNSIQDHGMGVQNQQDLHDSILNSSKVVIGPMNEAALSLEPRKTKKGKKDVKVEGHFPAKKKSTGRGSRNKPRKSSKKGGSGMDVGCVHTPSDAFIVERVLNASNKTLGSEICSPDSLPGSEILKPGEMLKVVETATESSELSTQDVPAKASKPSIADCLCDSGKLVGSKLPKCSKPKDEMSRRKSCTSNSSRRGRGNSCKQKKKDVQQSVSKVNTKQNGLLDQQYSGNNHLERSLGNIRHPESERSVESSGLNALGCTIFSDIEKLNAGDKHASDDTLKSSVINDELDDKSLPSQRAWVRCDECHKWRCISVALANSIEETNCRWICKDNTDKAFADCSIPQEKTNAEINAELEISDASGEEDASDMHRKLEGFKRKQLTVPHKAPWKPIKSNMFLHRNRKNQTIDEIMVCHCKPPPDGRLGCGEECLNRMLNIECVRGTCPCSDHCSNQQFQKRKYAKLKSFPCGRKGYGLQLLEDVSRGAFLIEYVGEVLDLNAYESRQREYAAKGQKHFYFMTLNGSEVIDACAKGNLGRFINHSCEPNCRTEKWMVNGEVCIGLFAIRDIKKGEEVTFDYNYVRVFGAAVKRCVCGSAECRGYIGGDPSSTEIVVQGDSDEEYPEPVMVEEDGDNEFTLDKIASDVVPVHHPEIVIKSNDVITESPSSIEQSGTHSKEEGAVGESPSALEPLKDYPPKKESIRVPPSPLPFEVQQTSAIEPEEITSPDASQSQETSLPITNAESKLSFDAVTVNNKVISSTEEHKSSISKARPVSKSSRSSLSIKKGKSDSHPFTSSKHQVLNNKPKKTLEGTVSSRLDGVDEKLVDLLDSDGGISKRKDATKGYLKLLVLTAASGDNGEAVQSIRDLSIILDALIKTKSRMVLVDIINKNGLQMLHNIMKQNRRNFNRTPIIRKLLKVLEYLAQRGILTLEHINSSPPCAGMESFKESIIALTRHNDVQVHQIARNFRDRWMPRNLKRSTYPDRDDLNRLELQSGPNCSRSTIPYKCRHDQSLRLTEAIDCISQGASAATPLDTFQEATTSSTNGINGRKRKSRWDQPSEIDQNQELPELPGHRVKQKLGSSFQQPEVMNIAQQPVTEVDNISNCCLSQQAEASSDVATMQVNHEDAPPGFSPHFNSVQSDDFSATAGNHTEGTNYHFSTACEVVSGYLQERYLAHLPMSYGIPVTFVTRLGTAAASAENLDSWAVAPSIPFHPFPPLPRFPCHRSGSVVSPFAVTMNGPKEDKLDEDHSSTTVSEDVISSDMSVSRPPSTGSFKQHPVDQMRCTNGNLGRKYFRQQKWNNWKNGPPWHWKRNSWGGSRGSNSRNGGQQCVSSGNFEPKVEVFNNSEGLSDGREHINSTLYQHHPQRQHSHH